MAVFGFSGTKVLQMAQADQEKWDRLHAIRGASSAPLASLVALAPLLPKAGTALDLAGGSGRHALWLAQQGLDVTLCDISPVALQLACERAQALGLPLTCVPLDLEQSPPPAGPWALILVSYYLDRALYARLPSLLSKGGLLVVLHPTRRNLERHLRPSTRFLLEEGELATMFGELTPMYRWEGWSEEGHHLAIFVGRAGALEERTLEKGR